MRTETLPYTPVSQQAAFVEQIRMLRMALGIHSGRGGARDRLRIALAVEDAFLRTDPPSEPDALARRLSQANTLAWQVHEGSEGLVCGPLPEEVRCAESPKLKGWEPLKMPTRPTEVALAPCPLTQSILTILKGESHGASEDVSRIRERRVPVQTLGREPERPARLVEPGPAVHPGRHAAVLP